MLRNIVKELMEAISPNFITKTAQTLQETKGGISTSLKDLVPTILYQLNHKLDSDKANDFFQLLKTEKNISIINQLSGVLETNDSLHDGRKDITNGFIKKLFGGQQKDIVDFVSKKNQLSSNSTKALMNISSILVIGYLSKLIRKDGLTLNSFKNFLLGQQDQIGNALPVGIDKLLGTIRPLATTGSSAVSASTTSNHTVRKGATAATYAAAGSAASGEAAAAAGASLSWAKWLLLIPILFFGLWYMLGSGFGSTTKNSTITEAKSPTPKIEEPKVVEEDSLTKATKEIAEQNRTETSTSDSKVETTVVNNNVVSEIKKTIKKEPVVETTKIYPPVRLEAPTSPGGLVNTSEFNSKGKSQTYNSSPEPTLTYEEAFGSPASTVVKEATKVSFDDYMLDKKLPESAKVIANKIEKQITISRPIWYTESKEVVDGNSGNVSIIKKTETIIEGRNTSSNRLSELRQSLSTTTYNAWFGHITNPISSTEYRLYSYLTGKGGTSNPIDKYTWFNLDNVKYKGYSSQMDYEASKGQLTRIASIVNANPNVKLKIGGFTSDEGKKKENRKLSLEMAEQAKAALVKLGIDTDRISTKGYGESNPLGLNDTEEGRMRNHRVGFRVISK